MHIVCKCDVSSHLLFGQGRREGGYSVAVAAWQGCPLWVDALFSGGLCISSARLHSEDLGLFTSVNEQHSGRNYSKDLKIPMQTTQRL